MPLSSSADASFTPSKRLIEMFADGARRYLQRMKETSREDAEDVVVPSAIELKAGFVGSTISERIQDVLVSLGGRRQAGVLANDVIAKESFLKEIEEEILEMLPIDQAHGHEFCQLLLSEVRSYVKNGGVIAGPWGRVQVTVADELAVIVTKPLPKPVKARPQLKTINF